MKSRAIYLGLTVFIALFLSFCPSLSARQQRVHVVQKGDTLWGVCNTYYHDPWIWPELWEMNKFITNPHWIKPGEVVMILDYEELKAKSQKKSSAVVKKRPLKKPKPMGIDVSSFMNTKALGFLSKELVEPWGKIFDFEVEKILLRENDTAYVKMHKHGIKPGNKFTIYNTSGPVNNPLTNEKFGYIYFYKGVLEIEKAATGYHIARISESFRSIQKNDLLMPYYPVSSCILPLPCNSALSPHIVAAKENLNLHGQYSVVYIDAGHDG